jgi:hypothetical protein
VPIALALLLLAFALMPRVQATAGLWWAVLGAVGFLLGWSALLWIRAARGLQSFRIDLVRPVRSHYIQAERARSSCTPTGAGTGATSTRRSR